MTFRVTVKSEVQQSAERVFTERQLREQLKAESARDRRRSRQTVLAPGAGRDSGGGEEADAHPSTGSSSYTCKRESHLNNHTGEI